MAFENEIANALNKWLAEQSNSISQTILDGSCKDFAEYKERCGKLRALWDCEEELLRVQRQRNNIEAIEDDQPENDRAA